MTYINGRYGGHDSGADPRRNWHAQYAPCPDHEFVPDAVAALRDGLYEGSRLDSRRAKESDALLAARVLNDVVTRCEPCRERTRSALVEFARKQSKTKIVNC